MFLSRNVFVVDYLVMFISFAAVLRRCMPSYNVLIQRLLILTIFLAFLSFLQDTSMDELENVKSFKMVDFEEDGNYDFMYWTHSRDEYLVDEDTRKEINKNKTREKKEKSKAKLKSFDELSPSDVLNYLGIYMSATYRVKSNFAQKHEIVLKNNGNIPIVRSKGKMWSIYFNHVHLPEQRHFFQGITSKLAHSNFILAHVDGGLFKLSPTQMFEGILPNESFIVTFQCNYVVSHSYVLPRWYVAMPNVSPVIIRNTDNENSHSATPFDNEVQWKKAYGDGDPFKLHERYKKYLTADFLKSPLKVLPTPKSCKFNKENSVDLKSGKWIVCGDKIFEREIKVFAHIFDLRVVLTSEQCPSSKFVKFKSDAVGGVPENNEAYEVVIDADASNIVITASDTAGAYYAVQTLRSLAEVKDGALQHTLPACTIQDAPRFGYRGLHIDVARNFIKLPDLLQIIETIAMYKINKLHLHLTDDEGWRIEIEGLPELTEIGSVRRHTETEEDAIIPALGSGPNSDTSGTGYYTISDYKKILEVAAANHVEVIPEIDTPGHCHAAIRAMRVRYNRFMKKHQSDKANEFLLNDIADVSSSAMSVQHFRNNAINPCMSSTYRFIDHLLTSFKKMHADIQPLRTIHMGGDEVARNSWAGSPVCQSFIKKRGEYLHSIHELQNYFMGEVAQNVGGKYGLSMGVWEEGALNSLTKEPIEKDLMHDADVIVYAWKQSTGKVAHQLANAGYKVVVAQASNLYFDHPQEPDPDEVGLTWATRYIDDQKVFSFRPSNLIEAGEKLLNPDNIIGIQANLWTELVRDTSTIHHQLFPRLIAFAERAWHKAKWESSFEPSAAETKQKDWEMFANVVGYKEIPRLRNRGILYRIPPPGVKIDEEGTMSLCSMYPGFHYRIRPGREKTNWSKCENGDRLDMGNFPYEFSSFDGNRYSRTVELTEKDSDAI